MKVAHRKGGPVAPLLALLLIAGPLSPALAQAQAQSPTEEPPVTKVVLLGTGNPNPTPDRMGPATAIIVGDNSYLIDAGTGLVRRAQAARALGIEALRAKNLKTAFLTHLHSDHTLGLADLILTPWVLERSEKLRLYGPKGTRQMVQHITEAYEADIVIRVEGSQPQNRSGWRVVSYETEGGFVYSDRYVTVESFRVCHGEMADSFGYRFTTPDKVIVVSGDTTYCPIVAEMAKGADILLHEVYSDKGFKKLPGDWQAYHQAYHTSASDLARLAKEAAPGLLILTHQLSWGDVPLEDIIDEVRAGYDGAVVSGKDLDIF